MRQDSYRSYFIDVDTLVLPPTVAVELNGASTYDPVSFSLIEDYSNLLPGIHCIFLR